ncbi:GtrA family protein [Bacillus carboniphilus]|uniref:GtrA family protein n=1 Tax=Bacillus carboniphilus TaxID=86663 RepID=A0ABY9JRX4_9BACI|nr:GtrA family protein [Bacillus carboniphilus]WLR41233.1 GtrA family protein [Bacillus carboniphilus]
MIRLLCKRVLALISANLERYQQFLLFSIVGISNTIVDFITFWMMYDLLNLHYLISQPVAYGAGVANSYFWNSRVTFQTSSKSKATFLKFVTVNILVLAFTMLCMTALSTFSIIVSKGIATILGVVLNFFLSKLWVFTN